MKKFFIPAVIFAVVFFHPEGYAKSTVREGEAVITFKKLNIPLTVKQGQLYSVSAEISTSKNIYEDLEAFFHVLSAADNTVVINNDFPVSIPSTQWTPGATIILGPVNGFIPYDLSPGTYNIQMGLYTTKVTPEEGPLYTREPYANSDIRDFIVGKITVEESKRAEIKKKDDLIISNFESESDIRKWYPRDCSIQQEAVGAPDKKNFAKITYFKNKGCCPAMILENFFQYSEPQYSDWSEYDVLRFMIFSRSSGDGKLFLDYPVMLQVKDTSGNRYQGFISREFGKDEPYSIMLSEIGKSIDISNVGNLSFYVCATPPDQDWIVYVGDIRLLSLGPRPEGPFIKFEGIKISKDKVKAGQEIEIEPSFSITSRFNEDYGLFLHIYRATDSAGWINADTSPVPATTQWELNSVIRQGPYKIYIPTGSPPGRYNIAMGFFLTRSIPLGAEYIKYYRGKDGVYNIEQPSYPVDYFKQPYTDYKSYGDWVVGGFEVE